MAISTLLVPGPVPLNSATIYNPPTSAKTVVVEGSAITIGTQAAGATGVWASTEAPDVFHGTQLAVLDGAWASTEAPDTMSAFGVGVAPNRPIVLDPSSTVTTTLGLNNLSTSNTATTVGGAKGFFADERISGKLYFEFFGLSSAGGANMSVGCNEQSVSYSSQGVTGGGGGGFAIYANGDIFINGTNVGSLGVTVAVNDVIGVCVDFSAAKMWAKDITQSGNWNNSGTADPATDTGGLAFTATPLVPFITYGGSGATVGTPCYLDLRGEFLLTGAIPTGFSAWDPTGATPNSTDAFDPSNKSSGLTLFDQNHLVITTESALNEGVLGFNQQSTGKWYIEFSQFVIDGDNFNFGIGVPGATLTDGSAPQFHVSGVGGGVGYQAHGFFPVAIGRDLTSTDVVAIALDIPNKRAYVNFNNTGWFGETGVAGDADPVAGTGFYDLSGSGALTTPCIPQAVLQFGPGAQVYMNEGDLAFVHSVPSGFIGWAGIQNVWTSTESPDTMSATGTQSPTITGTWASTEAPDVFHGTQLAVLTGTWESSEVPDRFFAFNGAPPSRTPIQFFVT